MAKHEQSNRSGEYRSGEYRNGEYRNGEYRNGEYRNGEYRNSEYSPRSRDKSQDRSRDRSRDRHERDRRRRRHRSPSYDSYSSSDSDDSGYSRSPSPRRPSRRHTSAAIYDDEDRGHRTRGRDHRRRPTREYHSEESRSRERGGIVEDLLGAIGLIQAKNKGSRGERSRSDEDGRKTTRDALQAALTAAAMEAFRTRKEGKLTPQRLMQIAGAAIAAGGLDALVDRNGGNGGSMKSIIESVVAGLATGKTMGKTVKHKRDGSVGDKVGTGFVGLAAKTLARSLSQGPTRRRTSKN